MELNSDFTSFTSICLCVCVCVHMFSFTHVCNRHQIQEAACSSAQVPSHQTFVASPTLLPPSPSLTSGICSSVLYLCDFILVLYKRNHPLCNLLSWSLFTQDSFEIHSSWLFQWFIPFYCRMLFHGRNALLFCFIISPVKDIWGTFSFGLLQLKLL